MFCEFGHKIFIVNEARFNSLAIELFRYQYENNPVYRQYADTLHTDISAVQLVEQIPFLPIRFFKTHRVTSSVFQPQAVFESSGTTQSIISRHFVKDVALYKESLLRGFEFFYGSVHDWCIIGLLPSYLERKNSSLVLMVDELVQLSKHPSGGFYLYEYEALSKVLQQLEGAGQKTLLIGVTFALLAFARQYPLPLKHTIVMETGGMKGKEKELTRPEVHAILKEAFNLDMIHSEYGMTELFSQAYSKGNGIFTCPPWMKVLLRNEDDPLGVLSMPYPRNTSYLNGVINVIDLANIYSCSFIATDDIGKLYPDGNFEVLGRMDNTDVRGCSLMVAGV